MHRVCHWAGQASRCWSSLSAEVLHCHIKLGGHDKGKQASLTSGWARQRMFLSSCLETKPNHTTLANAGYSRFVFQRIFFPNTFMVARVRVPVAGFLLQRHGELPSERSEGQTLPLLYVMLLVCFLWFFSVVFYRKCFLTWAMSLALHICNRSPSCRRLAVLLRQGFCSRVLAIWDTASAGGCGIGTFLQVSWFMRKERGNYFTSK